MRSITATLVSLFVAVGAASAPPPAAAQGGGRWQKAKARLVELPPDHPALEKLPALPVELDAPDAFLYGRTPGFTARADGEALSLTPSGKAKAMRIDAPGRRKIKIAVGGKAASLPVELLRDEGGTWTYRVPAVLEVATKAGTLCLLDADGDGWFDDVGVDLFAVGESDALAELELAPFTGDARLAGARFLVSADLGRAALWPVSDEVRAEYVEHVAAVNEVRKYAGLPPVGLDESLIAECEEAARYCSHNGMRHEQEPGKPGYTKRGAAAAARSNLGLGRDAADAVRRLLATCYHRNPYLSSTLQQLGVGAVDGYICSDIQSHGAGARGRRLVLAPAPFALDAPTAAGAETPNSLPDGEDASGPFISVLLPAGTKVALTRASVAPRGGEPLECASTDPTKVPSEARALFPENDWCINVIPRAPLEPYTIYDVRIEAGGKTYAWSFRTGG